MYKVFFKDRVFLLSDDVSLLDKNDNSFLFVSESELHYLIRKFESSENIKTTTVVYNDLNTLFNAFSSAFVNISAAGGLVIKGKYFLAIKRFGIWDLPKGHIEENENIKIAAIREVEEECGITKPEIVQKLKSTFHTYTLEETKILKKTYWYKMVYRGDEVPFPQKEEDIEEAIWIHFSEKHNFIANTYETIKDLLNEII